MEGEQFVVQKMKEDADPTYAKDMEDTVIFISNAELDGFREGDGDLMDKLVRSLNETYGVKAVRIILSDLNVPSDKMNLFGIGQLFSLERSDKKEEKSSQPTERITSEERIRLQKEQIKLNQMKLFEYMNSEQFKGKKKILYIGSRINIKDTGLLGESGSLFDENFIKFLKENDVKIVTCCLEYTFFKRAVKHLPRAYEMMKQHLMLSDKIHFLTEPDKADFLKTMISLCKEPILRPLELSLMPYQNKGKVVEEIKEEIAKNDELKSDCKAAAKKQREAVNKEYGTSVANLKRTKASLEKKQAISQSLLDEVERKITHKISLESKTLTDSSELVSESSNKDEEEVALEFLESQKKAINIDLDNIKQELIELNKTLTAMELDIKEIDDTQNRLLAKLDDKIESLAQKIKLLDLPQSLEFEPIPIEYMENLENRCCCISGIYTVDPLTEKEILSHSTIVENNIISILANRPCNILQFGMIRGEKGVDEAIDLSVMMKEKGLTNKVIIAGKLMLDLGMIKNIFEKVFNLDGEKFYRELAAALHSQEITEELMGVKSARQLSKIQNLITLEGKHEAFNNFCMNFYNKLAFAHPECVTNIELHFNVPEEKVRELAMNCRYAIKLDHKGMANNASTIASCMGFYLPVFTTCGLCTNSEFKSFELSNSSFENKYSGVAIMPAPEHSIDNDFFEVRPKNPSLLKILEVLENEHPKEYEQRLIKLHQLYQDKVFNCDNVTKLLLQEVFVPLSQTPKNEKIERVGFNL